MDRLAKGLYNIAGILYMISLLLFIAALFNTQTVLFALVSVIAGGLFFASALIAASKTY